MSIAYATAVVAPSIFNGTMEIALISINMSRGYTGILLLRLVISRINVTMF